MKLQVEVPEAGRPELQVEFDLKKSDSQESSILPGTRAGGHHG